jgi:hypothetical protein
VVFVERLPVALEDFMNLCLARDEGTEGGTSGERDLEECFERIYIRG